MQSYTLLDIREVAFFGVTSPLLLDNAVANTPVCPFYE
jgi:hypothetical protein